MPANGENRGSGEAAQEQNVPERRCAATGGIMRCAIHLEEEAVGTCVRCGKAVCLACRTTVESKIYCPVCAAKVYETAAGKRTGKPIVGGILGIIAGAINFSVGIILIADGATVESVDWSEMGLGQALVILGILAITGSSVAIARRNFTLAIIGGVCALPSLLLGIPALILIALSHEEFDLSRESVVCPGCGKANPKGAQFCMVCGRELTGRSPGA